MSHRVGHLVDPATHPVLRKRQHVGGSPDGAVNPQEGEHTAMNPGGMEQQMTQQMMSVGDPEYAIDASMLCPAPEEDRRPSRPGTPIGPHPDKRGSQYDVYGNKRMVGKPVSKAYIGIVSRVVFLRVRSLLGVRRISLDRERV